MHLRCKAPIHFFINICFISRINLNEQCRGGRRGKWFVLERISWTAEVNQKSLRHCLVLSSIICQTILNILFLLLNRIIWLIMLLRLFPGCKGEVECLSNCQRGRLRLKSTIRFTILTLSSGSAALFYFNSNLQFFFFCIEKRGTPSYHPCWQR